MYSFQVKQVQMYGFAIFNTLGLNSTTLTVVRPAAITLQAFPFGNILQFLK